MHLHTRNVNTAFRELVGMFNSSQGPKSAQYEALGEIPPISRRPYSNPNGSGHVLTIEEPVTITYSHPRERVLFNAVRDANPFFHLYEALWMLAGRNDVAPLAYYNSRISQYSDDGETFNGAYGYRWRKHPMRMGEPCPCCGMSVPCSCDQGDYTRDQLDIVVNHLKTNPKSRRAVLTMWNVENDLLKIGQPNPRGEIGAYRIGDKTIPSDVSKDVCCNLQVMFSLRDGSMSEGYGTPDTGWVVPKYLDMTVTNRSNDLLWGCLGGDFVCFSFLQEYMAARLGVEVGVYHHFSNNLHVYDDRKDWRPEELLVDDGKTPQDWSPQDRYGEGVFETTTEANERWWTRGPFTHVHLVKDPDVFEWELPMVVDAFSGAGPGVRNGYSEPFFRVVARPALMAFGCYKSGEYDAAILYADTIAADDWRLACTEWLRRRAK